MIKKFTRKDAEALCVKITKEFDEDFRERTSNKDDKKEGFASERLEELKRSLPSANIIAVHSYVENAEHIGEMYCKKCGHFEKKVMPNGYYSSWKYVCPVCNSNRLTTTNNYRDYGMRCFAFKMDEWYVCITYSLRYSLKGELEWYLNQPKAIINVDYVAIFNNEHGAFIYQPSMYKMIYDNNSNFLKIWGNLENINKMGYAKNDADLAVDDLVEKVVEWKKKKDNASKDKKTKSKSGMLEEMRLKYKPKTTPTMHADAVLYYLLSNKNNRKEYQCYCTKCNNTFIYEGNVGYDAEVQCPHCGNKNKRNSYSTVESLQPLFVYFESTNLPENDLLIRVFKGSYSFNRTNGFEGKHREWQRIFLGKKIAIYNANADGTFVKGTIRDLCYDMTTTCENGFQSFSTQSDEEIAEAIKNSCLKYSGLLESYGLGDKRYKKYLNAPNLAYLLAWYKNPSIEKVLKANMTSIVHHMIYYHEKYDNGKTLAETLRVPEAAMHIVKRIEGVSNSDLSAICTLFNADNNITYDMYMEIRNANFASMYLVDLKRNYNISFKKALEYLQVVYDNQCIEKNNAISIWTDYLRMAKILKIDLTDKTRMFPSSLKKEHDVAMFAYRSVREEVDKETFAEQAKVNAFFEYKYKDLIAIVPKTPEDIVEEATRQRNCLRSYVERVKVGNTVVVFIRKKDEPEKAYVTAEIFDGRLTQLKGYCNSNPRDKELMEFVDKWSKEKGFRK